MPATNQRSEKKSIKYVRTPNTEWVAMGGDVLVGSGKIRRKIKTKQQKKKEAGDVIVLQRMRKENYKLRNFVNCAMIWRC